MQQFYKMIGGAVLVFASASAMANPVSLGSIQHLYGTDAGRQLPSISSIFHPSGNCDVANPASMTVRALASNSCNRFADAFDFSGIAFDTIDRFEITLDFGNARGQSANFGLTSEAWRVRGASNYVQTATTFGTQLSTGGTQTFVFNSSTALFGDIVNAETFMLSFSANNSSFNFNLNSARVEVFGTPAPGSVPEPTSLALAGLALAGLGFARRRKV